MHYQAYIEIAPFEVSQRAAAGSRIANGHAAVANQFPYQVGLVSVGGELCGGSLIAAVWVLSAAHCTPGTQHTLRFGSLNREIGGVSQTSFYRVNHPDFNSFSLANDVSVLSIPTPLTFTAAIQPIRLPTAAQYGTSFVGVQATVSGWGETFPGSGASLLLRWVHMRPITNEECLAVFGFIVVGPHVICARGYVNPGNQGHCGGDSGGPLTTLEAGIPTQIGIVVFGSAAGCDLGFPSGYARVSIFTSWISSATGIPVRN